jgi:hypothetical protein
MALRKYKCKDVVMLMAAKTILQSMQANLGELGAVRTTWTPVYVTDLILRIDTAIENFLGLDKKQGQREATALLNQVVAPAMRDLAFIKTQIEVDFGAAAIELMKTLGLNQNLHKLDQETLIEVLYAFKKGLTESLRNTMTQCGTNPVLIDSIIGYANQLQHANISQESMKSTSQNISQEAIEAFNTIYDEVIGIGKIASKYYKDDKLKKDQFTFNKVVKNMGVAEKQVEEPAVQ